MIDPYKEDDFSQSSEYLRLALALLGKHKLPPSPYNFRIGYDQVSGRNVPIQSIFAEMESSSDELTPEFLCQLYHEYYSHDEAAFAKIKDELKAIILNVQSECESSGGELADYSQTLDHFAEILDQPYSAEQMSNEVRKVLDDTQEVQRSQQQMESNMQLMVGEVESLRKQLEQAKEESLTDALTGIANRKAFDQGLESFMQQASQENANLSLLLIDIDHFKKFNDNYGHLIGDKVIRFVASTLKRCIKGKDFCARYGGEEYAVILPETAAEGARAIAEQIRRAVSAKALKDSSSNRDYGRITVSVGVAQYHREESSHDLIARADAALYQAKERGRNRVVTAESRQLRVADSAS